MIEEQSTTRHTPVLVNEVLQFINPQPHKVYLDVTFGSGGHSRAILKKEPNCSVIVMDWDQQSLDIYFPPLKEEFGERVSCIWGSFAHLYKILKKEKIQSIDGILADFGTSYMHIFDRPGFSFRKKTFLDMRMSPAHYRITAADIIRDSDEKTLITIFQELGQEPYARRIARKIIEARGKTPLETTEALAQLIENLVPRRTWRIHPATQVFQALRMHVNHEIDNIKAFLPAAYQALSDGGRLVCISFHSGEDRLIKEYYREKAAEGYANILTKRVVTASQEELSVNSSARSAKLRALEVVKKPC